MRLNKAFWWFFVLGTSLLMIVQQCQGASPIDNLRHDYMKLEIRSWKLIFQHHNENISETIRNKVLKEVFIYHNDFLQGNFSQFVKETADWTTLAFPEFNHMYEWTHVEADLAAINSLFEPFQEFISQELNSTKFDSLRALDLADTVFNDKTWPVPKLCDQIESVMVGQALYFKLLMVYTPAQIKTHLTTNRPNNLTLP